MTKPAPNPSRKALTHGVYASDIVLPWESEDDLMELVREAREQLYPETPFQDGVVVDIAILRFKKRRLRVSTTIGYRRDPLSEKLRAAAETGGTEALAEHFTGRIVNGRTAFETMQQSKLRYGESVSRLSDMLMNTIQKIDDGTLAREEGNSKIEAIKLMLTSISHDREMMINASTALRLYEDEDSVVARPYRTAEIERELKLETVIDKQIEKKIQSLVTLKEYDRLYGRRARDKQPIKVIDHQTTDQVPGNENVQ